MDFTKIVEVFTITTPIFLLAGLGKALQLKGVLSPQNKSALSWITYYLALPALILNSFLTQTTRHLMQMELVWLSAVGILIPATITSLAIWKTKTRRDRKMATIYCSYWGNNGYMGIPLLASVMASLSLNEEVGVALAAVINGIATPVFIISAVLLMFFAREHKSDPKAFKQEAIKTVFHNPVLIALLFGMIFSYIRPSLPQLPETSIVNAAIKVGLATLQQIAHMGLPLALILVGSSLQLEEIKEDILPLSLSVGGKLVVAPLSVYLAAQLFFPNLSQELLIAIVLLNAVPGAVASYIIGARFGVAPQFTSSNLVISTGLSIASLPLWLYILL